MKYKLICFDMDGVLIKEYKFWMELHKAYGTYEEGKELTEKYLFTDYPKLVKEVVGRLWKGKSSKQYYETAKKFEYNEGIEEIFKFIKKNNLKSAIITGNAKVIANKIKEEYDVDFVYANEPVIKDDKLTGEFIWPVGAGYENKANIIKELCQKLSIKEKEVAFIGDSDIDIEAFKSVGLSIAFNSSSEKLKSAAEIVVESDDLKKIIPYLR